MRARRCAVLLACAGLSLGASSAWAQARFGEGQGFPYRRPAPPPQPIGVRVFAIADVTSMAAADTFAGVFGSSRLTSRGGGVEVIRLRRGLFVRAALSTSSASGSRVVVFDGTAVPLDIPLTLELRHLEVGGGWRQERRGARLVPYAGAGLLRLRYVERSPFADTGEDSDETFTGYAAFAGVDVSVWKWIVAGAEIQFRSVPDALGDGGASRAFNERDLGGVTARALIGIRK
ncbi:MAG: hypothetical protein IT184_04260 [Acidobacteria bacterium]|nr:hypothetical protein [Acidobacteriota bacterium]